jgi:uncharacterized membrane protein HdeD (DUF308 family)
MTQTPPANPETKKKKWLPYLIRGVMAVVIAATLVQQFVVPGSKASNFPIYLGVYFLANGILSLRLARSESDKGRGPILAALASIIGGLALIIAFPFSTYRDSLIATDLGRYVFSAIVIVIGLLQARGAVHMTPQPILKRAHLVLGFLEILLGIVVLAAPIDWEANAVALIWTMLVATYMFYVAQSLRSAQPSLVSAPSSL